MGAAFEWMVMAQNLGFLVHDNVLKILLLIHLVDNLFFKWINLIIFKKIQYRKTNILR